MNNLMYAGDVRTNRDIENIKSILISSIRQCDYIMHSINNNHIANLRRVLAFTMEFRTYNYRMLVNITKDIARSIHMLILPNQPKINYKGLVLNQKIGIQTS